MLTAIISTMRDPMMSFGRTLLRRSAVDRDLAGMRADLIANGCSSEQLARFNRIVSPIGDDDLQLDSSQIQVFAKCFRRLDESTRYAMRQYYVHGVSVEDIAHALFISEIKCRKLIRCGNEAVTPALRTMMSEKARVPGSRPDSRRSS